MYLFNIFRANTSAMFANEKFIIQAQKDKPSITMATSGTQIKCALKQ